MNFKEFMEVCEENDNLLLLVAFFILPQLLATVCFLVYTLTHRGCP